MRAFPTLSTGRSLSAALNFYLSHYFELPDSNWGYFPEFFRLGLRVFTESLRMWPQVDHEIGFAAPVWSFWHRSRSLCSSHVIILLDVILERKWREVWPFARWKEIGGGNMSRTNGGLCWCRSLVQIAISNTALNFPQPESSVYHEDKLQGRSGRCGCFPGCWEVWCFDPGVWGSLSSY